MPKRIKPMAAATVEEYLAALAPVDRAALDELRALVRKVVPAVEEGIQYQMPTFTLDGGLFCSMASQKNYLCLYVGCDSEIVAEHAAALAHLDMGKSCIRFKRIEDLPLGTIRRMLAQSAKKRKSSAEKRGAEKGALRAGK